MKTKTSVKAGEPSCPATSNGKALALETWDAKTKTLTCIYAN